jgi:hypothetical protein
MAIVQVLFAIFSRTAGRVLNTAFAWATIALFGRVPPRQQICLSVMAFGSMAWLISVIGVAFPSMATFLLALVTIPSWVRPGWIRLAMDDLQILDREVKTAELPYEEWEFSSGRSCFSSGAWPVWTFGRGTSVLPRPD